MLVLNAIMSIMNRNKKISIFLALLAVMIISYGIFTYLNSVGNQPTTLPNVNQPSQNVFDGKNSTFEINGQSVTLKNGSSEIEIAPGSASKINTVYFGNEATGDLTGDGRPDTAFLVKQVTGGTGVFYYVVVAIKTETGFKTTNAFLIGDRIAPQTTQINISAKELYINFAERKPGEPMVTQPSVGATLILQITPDGKLSRLMLE